MLIFSQSPVDPGGLPQKYRAGSGFLSQGTKDGPRRRAVSIAMATLSLSVWIPRALEAGRCAGASPRYEAPANSGQDRTTVRWEPGRICAP
jgi:hypothetical protein